MDYVFENKQTNKQANKQNECYSNSYSANSRLLFVFIVYNGLVFNISRVTSYVTC